MNYATTVLLCTGPDRGYWPTVKPMILYNVVRQCPLERCPRSAS